MVLRLPMRLRPCRGASLRIRRHPAADHGLVRAVNLVPPGSPPHGETGVICRSFRLGYGDTRAPAGLHFARVTTRSEPAGGRGICHDQKSAAVAAPPPFSVGVTQIES